MYVIHMGHFKHVSFWCLFSRSVLFSVVEINPMQILLSHHHSLNIFPSSSSMIAENETGYGWQVDKSLRKETIMFKFVFFFLTNSHIYQHKISQSTTIWPLGALGNSASSCSRKGISNIQRFLSHLPQFSAERTTFILILIHTSWIHFHWPGSQHVSLVWQYPTENTASRFEHVASSGAMISFCLATVLYVCGLTIGI